MANNQSMDQETSSIITAIQAITRGAHDTQVPLADRLWTSVNIAEYLGLSSHTVRQKVVSRPGFPAPVALLGKRWFAGEVIDWCKKNSGRMPSGRNRKTTNTNR